MASRPQGRSALDQEAPRAWLAIQATAPPVAQPGRGGRQGLQRPPAEQWRPPTEGLVRKFKLQDGIRRASSLPHGWDGYAAEPPSRTAVEGALRALDVLYGMRNLPTKAVALADGGVALVIMARPYYSALEVYDDGGAAVVFSDRRDRQLAWDVSLEETQLKPAIERLHELMYA